MMLSKNFSLYEFIKSNTASRLGIKNIPSPVQVAHLRFLCKKVLQPLRDKSGIRMRISSGFRCEELNKAVGGVSSSRHLDGLAADIVCSDSELNELAKIALNTPGIFRYLDELLFEHSGKSKTWLHIAASSHPRHHVNLNYIV